MPTRVDSNSPVYWREGLMYIFNSANAPLLSYAPSNATEWETVAVDLNDQQHTPVWVESVWEDEDGTLLMWYHHEPSNVCGDSDLTVPRIGAAVSFDGGRTMKDLGIILEAGEAPNCGAKNGFFAGGHGDFSVILDRERKFFYFVFTSYSGPVEQQGVALARLAYEDRHQPGGAVQKYFEGEWNEPGIGGRVTPLFPAKVAWEAEDTDSFWGPSIHFNTHLGQYVVLMNHACCEARWPQEGIYATFTTDLADPAKWTVPKRILDKDQIGYSPGWYPQVLSMVEGDPDTIAGRSGRLFIHGTSEWQIVFEPKPQ